MASIKVLLLLERLGSNLRMVGMLRGRYAGRGSVDKMRISSSRFLEAFAVGSSIRGVTDQRGVVLRSPNGR